jgi:spermidine/putrescine ABC transporter ATP-binding subunit
MATVTLTNIEHEYAHERVIEGVDLKIEDGEFVTLLGPSGCGKTTTLRVIAGFVSPTQGRVHFDKVDMTNVPTQMRNIGMVFQDYALFPHLSVVNNVAFPLRFKNDGNADKTVRAHALLEKVRMGAFADRMPSLLSGGQQQRVAIARALARTPTVLLMDEPLGALDLKLREAMQDELYGLQRELGITTVYVTHDQEEALTLSHRVALMRRGKIEQIDSPEQLYARPKTAFAEFFLGRINFMRGRVMERLPGGYRTDLGMERVVSALSSAEFNPGDDVTIAVRPEHVQVKPRSTVEVQNTLQGRVNRCKFLGKTYQLEVALIDGTAMVAYVPARQSFAENELVEVVWHPSDTHVFRYEPDREIGLA